MTKNTRPINRQFAHPLQILLAIVWIAAMPFMLAATVAAQAQPVSGEKIYEFSIPSQPRSPALLEFSRTTGIALLLAKSDLQGEQAVSLRGKMTAESAIQALLAGTGLGYTFIDSETLSISKAHALTVARPTIEDAPSDNSDGLVYDKAVRIEETIVSARRRNEQLQKIPIPISVIDSTLMDNADILSLQDVAMRVPGLNVSYFSIGQPSIHMRGIGSNDDGAALNNSVVIFLDDIYVGRISTIDINVLDLQRIEVLRGPQGTLYGKNAIGGAINMVSALPRQQVGLQLTASAGNLGSRSFTGKLTGPLGSDALLGRLSVSSTARDGWQDNLILAGEKQHDDQNRSLRAKLLFIPQDNLEWYLAYDHSEDQLNSSGRIPVVGRVPVQLTAHMPSNTKADFALPTDIFAALGGNPTNATNGVSGYTDRTISGLTSRISFDQPHYRLTSITGYRDSTFEWLEDSTGLPESIIALPISDFVDETHSQFSQELRWSSVEGKTINYVLGLYYLREDTNRKERFTIGGKIAQTHQQNKSDSFAIFGETSYLIDAETKLTLGARYTYDTKNLDQQSRNGGSPAIILEDFDLNSSGSWKDISPSASLSHQVNDDLMVFLRVARGFKNGGFQGAPSTADAAKREIDPETAWDYELGLKSRWYASRLQLNIAGFHTNYKDLQVTQFKTVDNFGVFETSNAATATLTGLEAELVLNATESIELGGNYAWLDARYDNFNDVQGRDFSGNRLRQAPQHSLSLNARYRWAFEPGELSLRLDYRYQSRSYQEPDNEVTKMPAFDLLDAKLSFASNVSNWEVSLWAKNLLDQEYITHLYLLGGNDYALFGTPRTVGVSLRYSSL